MHQKDGKDAGGKRRTRDAEGSQGKEETPGEEESQGKEGTPGKEETQGKVETPGEEGPEERCGGEVRRRGAEESAEKKIWERGKKGRAYWGERENFVNLHPNSQLTEIHDKICLFLS